VADPIQRGASREALIVDALSAVFRILGEEADSPRLRELRAQALSYERSVKHWTAVPPSDAQLDAMLDLVTDLHAKAADAKRRRRS
jgi:hypothetical protein